MIDSDKLFFPHDFKNDNAYYVVKHENIVIACFALTPIDEYKVILSDIFVLDKYRCKGVGSYIVEEAMLMSKNKEISLNCPTNLENFFKEFGFKLVQRIIPSTGYERISKMTQIL